MNVTLPWSPSADVAGDGVSAKIDNIRKSLGEHAESLAEVAADYGSDAESLAAGAASQTRKVAHETGEVVATVAKDPIGSIGAFFQSLIDALASFISSLTESGRKTATDLGHEAQAAATELRKVRITTEPKKTGPDFLPGITLLGGFAAGVALVYFFDPEQGKRRRTLLRDQLTKWTRATSETVQGKTKDLSNRAQGAALEARKSLQGVMASGQPSEGEAQPWTPTGEGQPASIAQTDPSTTDTWGDQSQSSDVERIQIS